MKVRLKSVPELKKLGYKVITAQDLPPEMGNMHTIVKYGERVAMSLDLNRTNDMPVVPSNGVTEETYEHFKECFEVIE